MSKFKLEGVGVDLTNLSYNPGFAKGDEGFRYLYTTLSNDYLVKDYVQSLPEASLIVGLDFLDSAELSLNHHLRVLERTRADLLLVSSSADWNEESVKSLSAMKALGIVTEFGISDPVSVEDIEKIKGVCEGAGISIGWVSLTVCPLDFYYEIHEYCEKNKMRVIGHNIFGGYVSAARNIQAFSVPYLLGFAANNCNIILLSGKELVYAIEDARYLSAINPSMEADPGYTLRKSTHRSVKELKQAIYTSLKVENMVVPYNNPEALPDYEDFVFKIGTQLSIMQLQKIDPESINIKDEVMNLLKVLYYPKDAPAKDIFATMRYKVTDFLRNRFPEYDIDYVKVGDTILLIRLDKPEVLTGKFIWQKTIPGDTKTFFLAMGPGLQEQIAFIEAKDIEDDDAEISEEFANVGDENP